MLGYPSVYHAGDHVPDVLRFQPIGLEGLDDRLIDDMKKARIHPENVSLLRWHLGDETFDATPGQPVVVPKK